MNTFVEQISQ